MMGFAKGAKSNDDPNAQGVRGWGADFRDMLGDPGNFGFLAERTATLDYSERPQDKEYEFPGRGEQNHGITEDTKSSGYFPNQVDGDARVIEDDPNDYEWSEIMPAIPVPVYSIPNPQVTVNRMTRILNVFGPTQVYSVGAGVIDIANAIQVLGQDETRKQVTFRVNSPVLVSTGTFYKFAIADNQGMVNPTILDATYNSLIVYSTKTNLYAALVPVAAYAGANINAIVLDLVIEFETVNDNDPDAVVRAMKA